MDEQRLAALRRWATELPTDEERVELQIAARSVLGAAERTNGHDGDGYALDDVESWARRTAARSGDPEVRSAARTVLAALRDVERPPRRRDGRRPPRAWRESARPARPKARPLLARIDRFLHERWRMLLLAAAGLVVAVAAVSGAKRVLAPPLDAQGPKQGARIGFTGLARLAFRVPATRSELADQRWTLDGSDVSRFVRSRGRLLVYRPQALSEGPHVLEIEQSGGILGTSTSRRFEFVVDLTPPQVRLLRPARVTVRRPLELVGRVEPGARLRAGRRPVDVTRDGRFSTRFDPPVPASVVLQAVDDAGNAAGRRVRIEVVPRRPPVPVRGVHVTATAWATPHLRAGVLRLIAQRRINTVELDLKDESGIVGWNTSNRLARRIGATRPVYNLDTTVRELHERGVWVVGRLVCFRDPIHAAAAWRAGRRSEVVQTPDGAPYAGYGGFTNFANPAVRRYNIALAEEAARAGVDDVLYDYVRRPDGPLSSMAFPGLRGTPERSIVTFLAETRRELARHDTFLGASVFGVAATRPLEVAQDIPTLAREVDYVAPMLYPSHWGRGEYGVEHPNAEPYAIVRRSLADFKREVRGTGARIVPWLQDFSLGVSYGPAEVRAQIRAAQAVGIREFLLWDPLVTYTGDALTTDAPRLPDDE